MESNKVSNGFECSNDENCGTQNILNLNINKVNLNNLIIGPINGKNNNSNDNSNNNNNGIIDVKNTDDVTSGITKGAKGAGKNGVEEPSAAPDFWRWETVEESASYIRRQLPASFQLEPPEVGIVCGSGCGAIADAIVGAKALKFEDIPHFMATSVPGHKGLLIFGKLGGKSVILLQGRFHAYEGYHYGQAAFPIRVMKLLGARAVVITLATGGLNPEYQVGDMMVVKDHISFPNISGCNPLKGPNDARLGPRFVAQNNAYDRVLRKLAQEAALKLGFNNFVREGNVAQLSGPNYETPMECRFLRMIGADAVGMSNAHECLVARHMDMKVISIALITNKCVMDVDDENETNHEEVLETGKNRADDLRTFVQEIVTIM